MTTSAHVSHSLPGRVRVRVHGRRKDEAFFRRVSDELLAEDGILQARSNARTESLLILHELEDEALAGTLERAGLRLAPGPVRARRPTLTRQMARNVEDWDRRVLKATDGALDLDTLWFVFLVGGGAFQALRGRLLPAGVSLLLYASRRLTRESEEASSAGATAPGAEGEVEPDPPSGPL